MADNFTASARVLQLNQLTRIFGSNVFTLDGLYQVLLLKGPLFFYLVGLLAAPVVLIFAYAAWQYALTIQSAAQAARVESNKRKILLGGGSVLVALALCSLIVALSANTEMTTQVDSMRMQITQMSGATGLISGAATRLVENTAQMDALGLQIATECAGHPRVNAPIIPETSSPVLGMALGLFDSIGPLLVNAEVMLYRVFNMWRIQAFQGLALSLFFVLILATGFMFKSSSMERKMTRRIGWVCQGTMVMLMVALWLMVALFHVLGTVGADVCAPKVDQNVNRLLNEYMNGSPTELLGNGSVAVGAKLNPCVDDPVYPMTLVGGSLCYYQSCAGASPLESVGLAVGTNAGIAFANMGAFQAALMNDSIANPNDTVSDPAACFGHLQAYGAAGMDLFSAFTLTANLTDCPTLKTVYQSIVHKGFCDGVVDQDAMLLFSTTFGLVMVMLFVFVFQMVVFSTGGATAVKDGTVGVLNPAYGGPEDHA